MSRLIFVPQFPANMRYQDKICSKVKFMNFVINKVLT